ncbi:MAG: YfiH family protein [Paracoccaceae bacterium]|jgi:YfiH family protein
MLKSASLDNITGVRHAFFTRDGGVSDGIYASLNCGAGSSDDPTRVQENKRRAAAHLELEEDRLVTLYQVHSPEVVTLTDPGQILANRPEADAMVTRTPGVALGILTADCAPVLFADAEGGVIGAAHAGWRGALGGVVENTIAAMENLGATRRGIRATVGPCIAQSSYQVGADFPDPFVEDDAGAITLFRPDGETGKHLFDLQGYVLRRLEQAGIGSLGTLDVDTYAAEDLFFSYRRTCHRGEDDYGRGLSAITLTEAP